MATEAPCWTNQTAADIVASVSEQEQKRQNTIFELIANQANYVDELNKTDELYYKPLCSQDIVPADKRQHFIADVFNRFSELAEMNRDLLAALQKRQQENPVVGSIGDIMLIYSKRFGMYPEYCENREHAKHELELEMRRNSKLADFLQQQRTGKTFSLNEYLQIPINRFVSYNLLLKDILKRTDPDAPDTIIIPQAVDSIKAVGKLMDDAADRTRRRRRFLELSRQIGPNSGSLSLLDPKRQILNEGNFVVQRSTGRPSIQVHVFLFDHMVLMTKEGGVNQETTLEQTPQTGEAPAPVKRNYKYEIYKRPMPLDLLRAYTDPSQASGTFITPSSDDGLKALYLEHFGRSGHGGCYTLIAETQIGKDIWSRQINEQAQALAVDHPIGEEILTAGVFSSNTIDSRICGTTVFANRLIVATPTRICIGVDGSAGANVSSHFTPVVLIDGITQIEVISELQMLFVLASRTLYTISLKNVFQSSEPVTVQGARKIAEDISFFKIGVSVGQTLVSAITVGKIRSYIKLFDPKRERRRFLSRGSDMLVFKEFYIPTEATSIDFLASKLIVGCTRGFELVDLQKLGAESNAALMDPTDPNLTFMTSKTNHDPIGIFRVEGGDYLLCFREIAFYIDKHGSRSRTEFLITWNGVPNEIAFLHPYILAFSSNFVEVFDSSSGVMMQAIHGSNIKASHTLNDIHLVKRNHAGSETVSRLVRRR